MRSIRVVGDAEARALLDLDRAYEAVRDAYRQAASEGPVLSTPPALLMRHKSAPAVAMKVKGAQLPAQRVAGFRLVADLDAEGGEVSDDLQFVYDLDRAALLGAVELNTLHAVRTALTGVVALEALRGPACRRIAVLGAGRIADWLVPVLRTRLAPEAIRVVASRPERAAAFAARHGGEVAAADTVAAAVAEADAVIGISAAAAPILFGSDLRPGMTVVGMGGGHECDLSVLAAADRFVVDEFGFASVMGSLGAWIAAGAIEAGAARARLDAELGQVLAGAPGRTGDGETVFAIVQGMACCDLAIAAEILSRSPPTGAGIP